MSYIEENGYFTFNGVKSSDYGVWITGAGTYSAPARRYTSYEVAGRNGELTIADGSFEDVNHVYNAFIARDFSDSIEAFRNQMMQSAGKLRLTDSYHTDEYYLARFMDGIDPSVLPAAQGGSFKLTFVRDPRRFLTVGETPITISSADSITNPTLYPANPLIRVYGYGTLTIGDNVVTIEDYDSTYIDIDSEMKDCYIGDTNYGHYVSFSDTEFPVLKAGSNSISFSGNITAVTITPNWWRL